MNPRVHSAGIDFRASWIGNGNQLADMRQAIEQAGLSDKISTPGFLSDRVAVLQALREADVFLFCHKTPESPRCLIEALVSATPIVGYKGAFAQDLISQHGGGLLSPLGDTEALAANVITLARHPSRLAELIRNAAKDGDPFDDVTVFRHRSELIREHLPLVS